MQSALELPNAGGISAELAEAMAVGTATMRWALLVLLEPALGFAPTTAPRSAVPAAAARAARPVMDETIMEKAFSGELEQEGAENVFMSELGWATYLDKNAGSSYNMNERPSKASDGYFTPDVFSNPVDGAAAEKRASRL